jgi:cytochrome c biogenesis protein CcmG/thiol:disulfide interchange protein DsbE
MSHGARSRTARAALLVTPALAFVALLAFAVARTTSPPARGEEAPGFTAPLLDGNGSFSLSDARGRPVLLNFWASWCEPCRDEGPMLSRAHHRYGDDVAFVGVDVRDSVTDARAFAERYGLDYTLVRDDGGLYRDYGLTGQPETFFIDSDGVIVEHVRGPLLQRDLVALLEVLVRRAARGP